MKLVFLLMLLLGTVSLYADEAIKTLPEKESLHVTAEEPIDYSQYLRKNIKVEEKKEKSPLPLFVIGGFLLLVIIALVVLKRRRNDGEVEALVVDLHSHLIPGIDDGAQTLEESLQLVRGLKSLGYTKLITTPHTMMHLYPNSTESITQGLKVLKSALLKNRIVMDIDVASEYFLDEHLMKLIEKGDILTFGDNYLLFEMSYVIHPVNYIEMIKKMIAAGYKPVLAHPERYLYMGNDFSKYVSLRAMGVYLQLNINSIGGFYSSEVQRNALRLIDEGMISFLGSDAHRLRHLESLVRVKQSSAYRELFKKNIILNNTLA